MAAEPHPAMRFEHGEHHGQPARVPADDGATRRAERGRRNERLDLDQQRPRAFDPGEHRGPGAAQVAFGEEQFRGICHFPQPGAGHLEHADLVGRAEPVLDRAQDPELVRALALEREHRVDHVLDDAGSRDLPVLGHMADEQHRRAGAFREADQRLRGRAHLGYRAGRGFHRVRPHGLNGIDDDEPRRLAVSEGCQDVFDRGLGCDLDGGVRKAQALRAKPDLRGCLLAGNVDGALVLPCDRCGDLDEQGGLADARIAADQQYRAPDKAAAGDAVELSNAASEPRRLLRVSGQGFERERPALARASGCRRFRRAGTLFGDRVPLAAGLALSLPAARHRAAVLTDEGQGTAGHGRSRESASPYISRRRFADSGGRDASGFRRRSCPRGTQARRPRFPHRAVPRNLPGAELARAGR